MAGSNTYYMVCMITLGFTAICPGAPAYLRACFNTPEYLQQKSDFLREWYLMKFT